MGFVGDGSVYRVLWGFAAWEVGGDDMTVGGRWLFEIVEREGAGGGMGGVIGVVRVAMLCAR